MVTGLVAAVLVTGVLSWVFNFIQRWYTARVVGDVVLDLRTDAFDAVLERDMSFYDEHPTGKVVSRVTSDTDDFANVVTLTLNLISQLLLVVVITALLFARDAGLALLVLAVVPVVIVDGARLPPDRPRHHPPPAAFAGQGQRHHAGDDERHLGGARTSARSRRSTTSSCRSTRRTTASTLQQGFVFGAIFPVLFIVAGLGTVVLVYFGGRARARG